MYGLTRFGLLNIFVIPFFDFCAFDVYFLLFFRASSTRGNEKCCEIMKSYNRNKN